MRFRMSIYRVTLRSPDCLRLAPATKPDLMPLLAALKKAKKMAIEPLENRLNAPILQIKEALLSDVVASFYHLSNGGGVRYVRRY